MKKHNIFLGSTVSFGSSFIIFSKSGYMQDVGAVKIIWELYVQGQYW
jgi:hypothetical protein